MKLKVDWKAMLLAVAKALWPFVAGGLGGIFAGCSLTGSGVGVTL